MRHGWPLLPDVLAAPCSTPGSQASVALYLLFLKGLGMSVFCALCVTSGCLQRQTEPNTTDICLRWLLPRISDVKGGRINVKSRKSPLLVFGMHVAVLDSFHMFGNLREFIRTLNNILGFFLVEGIGYSPFHW